MSSTHAEHAFTRSTTGVAADRGRTRSWADLVRDLLRRRHRAPRRPHGLAVGSPAAPRLSSYENRAPLGLADIRDEHLRSLRFYTRIV